MTAFRAAPFKAACVQLRSSDDVADNIRETVRLVREAAAQGASFIATPGKHHTDGADGGAKLARSFDEAHDPALPVFAALAKELNVWLLIGSLAIKGNAAKTANRSFLFAPDGSIVARYSKIHLFDVVLAGGESYKEVQHRRGWRCGCSCRHRAGQDWTHRLLRCALSASLS